MDWQPARNRTKSQNKIQLNSWPGASVSADLTCQENIFHLSEIKSIVRLLINPIFINLKHTLWKSSCLFFMADK